MSDIFEIKWRQSSGAQGTTPQSQTYSIPTDDSIFELNPINQNWGSKGCYAGALAQNGSLMGAGSTMEWDGWNEDRTQSDMRDFTISSYQNSAQQNLRLMVKFGSSGFRTRQNFKWTNVPDAVAGQIQSNYSNMTTTSNVREYNPYTRAETNISITGTPNSPLVLAPINNLKINQLIWQPTFYIAEIEYYNYENGCYKSTNIVAPVAKTFAQIKPIDKTPAGADYDEDLWTKGWKEIQPTNEGGRRFRFITGCILTPYYGKASYTYNSENDAYETGTNPDDGLVYGTRNIFGEMLSDSGKYPVINTTNCSRPCLTVMSEVLDENTGAVIYSTPPGIMFANISSHTVETSQFTVRNYQLNSAHQLFTGSIYWTDFWFNNNDTYNQFFKSSADEDGDPTLTCPQIIGNVGGLISTLDESYPTGTLYFLADGPIAYSTDRAGTRINPMTCSYFSGQQLWATIASLGCYVSADIETAQKAQVGAYVGNNNRVYLGEMSSSGITNGIMLQGDDIADAPQAAIDDIIEGTPYEPITPQPPSPDDDPTDKPKDTGKGEGKITGDKPGLGDSNRWAAGIGVNYYALTPGEASELCQLLWEQPKSFYEAINIVSDESSDDIFKYISCFRYLPINLNDFSGSISSTGYPVHMGTGATLKDSDGYNKLYSKVESTVLLAHFAQWDLGKAPFSWHDAEFLNYTPYSKLIAVLPYVGPVELDLNKISAFTDSIKDIIIDLDCIIDIKTGIFTYILLASGQVVYLKDFNPCYEIQLSGNNSVQQSAAITSANFKLASSVLNAVGDVAAGLQKQSKLENKKTMDGKGTLSKATIAFGIAEQLQNTISHGIDIAQASAAVSLASRQVPEVYGSTGGSIGSMIVQQRPYLIQYRIKTRNASNYGHTSGYCSESAKTLSEVKGFTQVVNPDLTSIAATAQEIGELSSILTTGFYV